MSADLEKAYLKHKQSLLAIAINVTKCQALAEDAIQIAFSKLVQNRAGARDLDAYVFQSVRNAAIDIVRHRKRDSEKTESFFVQSESSTTNNGHALETSQIDGIIQGEEYQRLRTTIDSLPAPDREIILLKIFSGFTFEKIGEITQTNPNSVATRYRRLLEKLKDLLKERA